MKQLMNFSAAAVFVALVLVGITQLSPEVQVIAQRGTSPAAAVTVVTNVPILPFEVVQNFFKITPDQNFGETLAVAVNSKGNIVVINHPGTATSGPLYGNATTQLWEFDSNGKFLREIGKGVYGLGYAHSARFDRYDNLWIVDKGTNSVMKFNPAGYVTMNLGRRPEGYEGEYHRLTGAEARPTDGNFNAPTDIGWDGEDNIYVSDGYGNSRVAKMNKNGDWIKSWGSFGTEPGQFRTPHSLQVDKQGNVYVADRANNRIQVFDSDGNFKRTILLNASYDKARHPVLGNLPANRPDATSPWTMCINTNGPTQYLYAADNEPGRIYKMTLDGRIVGMFGESGRGPKQFNWPHGLACPSEDVLFVADMNNWRVLKLTLNSGRTTQSSNR